MMNEETNPEITLPEVVETPVEAQIAVSGLDDDIKSLLMQAVDITQDGLVHEPTCTICRSAVRAQAEEKWLETKDTSEVKKIIKDHEGVTVTNSSIRHHMAIHLDREGGELQKVEYANRIQRMSNSYLSTVDRIQMSIAILDDRLMSVNALSPSNDFSQAEIEKIQGDLTVKLMGRMENLIKLKSSIESEMHKRGEFVSIPKAKFIDVFNTAIADAKNEDIRKAIYDLIKKLEN